MVQSDRKLSAEQYLTARRFYLEVERDFLRKIGIIVPKPPNYNEQHEEVWQEDEAEKIDGLLVFNADEVPWNININTKQVVSVGERPQVRCSGIPQISKYRKGTLVICMNCGAILFVMVIFPCKSSGARLMPIIQSWLGHLNARIFWTISSSGSLNEECWLHLVRAFQNMTKPHRKCLSLQGTDWQRAVALYIDNYGVHLQDDIGNELASKFGIFLRPLLKNASHLQQPVDQHIGLYLKMAVVKNVTIMAIDTDRMECLGIDDIMDLNTFRARVSGFVSAAIEAMNANAGIVELYMLAWHNLGLLTLPLDGSRDSDPNSLLQAHTRASMRQERMSAKEMQTMCIIPRREISEYTHSRQIDLQNIRRIARRYSVQAASVHAFENGTEDSLAMAMLKMDLGLKYARNLTKWRHTMNQDFTRARTRAPNLFKIVSAHEVLACKATYEAFPEGYDVQWLYTNRIGIPCRNEYGDEVEAADLLGIIHTSQYLHNNKQFLCIQLII